MLLLYVILLAYLVAVCSQDFSDIASKKFEDEYIQTCSKYPWINRTNNDPHISEKSIVFDFSEDGGGLGDRFSGVINAYAFALRTNRQFFISVNEQHKDLFKAFQTYQNYSVNYETCISKTHEDSPDILDLRHCHNLNIGACSLDKDPAHKTIIIKGNRVNMCRWTELPKKPAYKQMINIGITNDSNLYEVSGCMLRSIFWPTVTLWREMNQLFSSQSSDSYRLALHYRCGDIALSNDLQYCEGVVNDAKHYQKCANTLLQGNSSKDSNIYITSDNHAASKTLMSGLDVNKNSNVFAAPFGCHIDFPRGFYIPKFEMQFEYPEPRDACTYHTLIYWFALSLNDNIIAQCKPIDQIGPELSFYSSFPRLAGIYSLKHDSLRCADHCVYRLHRDIARLSHGNWRCCDSELDERGRRIKK
mmetsp:Transcript_18633/g.18726  ORF Transcript_18633/g.18726 Transcript_18633/m.18726 type:complete len:417 (+) Transcript_18633:77-1327(+)